MTKFKHFPKIGQTVFLEKFWINRTADKKREELRILGETGWVETITAAHEELRYVKELVSFKNRHMAPAFTEEDNYEARREAGTGAIFPPPPHQ